MIFAERLALLLAFSASVMMAACDAGFLREPNGFGRLRCRICPRRMGASYRQPGVQYRIDNRRSDRYGIRHGGHGVSSHTT